MGWRGYAADGRGTGSADRGAASCGTPVRRGTAFGGRCGTRRHLGRATFLERFYGRRGRAPGAAEVSWRGQTEVPSHRAAWFVGAALRGWRSGYGLDRTDSRG